MFILERLISRGSRSLGVMLGTSRRGAGHAQGGRESDCDNDAQRFFPATFLPLPFLAFPRFSVFAVAPGLRVRTLV